MRFRLPSLNALRAFEAAARHCSFTEASRELCVGQGAISRHVAKLEKTLGVPLFRREHRGVSLTPTGETYFQTLHQAFQIIHEGTSVLREERDSEVVRIKSPPTFASRWLMPRLGAFSARRPNIEIRISTSHDLIDFEREEFDLAIAYGDGEWPKLDASSLVRESLIMVCRPRLADGRAAPQRLEEIRRYVLLHSLKRPGEWRRWLDAVGLTEVPDVGGLRFGSSVLAYQAAIDGLGLVIAQPEFVADELADGRMVAPFDYRLTSDNGYFLTRPANQRLPTAAATFRDWLLGLGQAAGPRRSAAVIVARPGRKPAPRLPRQRTRRARGR